jgi:uncharacterized protein
MKIGIISDTHDNLRATDKTLKYLLQQNIKLLIHAGDWVMPFTMRVFVQFTFPIKGVLGNGDPDIQKFQYQLQNLKALKGLQLDLQPKMQDFIYDGKRIAVNHGDDPNIIKTIIDSQLFDLFCCGHTHTSKIEKIGKTLIVNPGSMVGFSVEQGGIVPRTIAIYNTLNQHAEIINIDNI